MCIRDRVTAVEGVDGALALDGVVDVDLPVEPGSVVQPIRSSWDRLGQVIAVAPDADAAVALCEKACAAIRVTTTPDPAE